MNLIPHRFAIKTGGSMIPKTHFRDILTVIGLSVVLTIFITRPGHSQDTTKTKGDTKVRITAKIMNDKDGKRQEFDTTINLDRKLKPGEEQEIMKEFEMKFKDLDDQMKYLEVELNEMKLPDSGMMDSVQHITERMFKHRGGPGNMHFRRNFSPRAFNFDYNFEIPDVPDVPQPFVVEFNDENVPGMPDENQIMHQGNGGSLNDLLGDIPMDRVKSYSIKDTKNGKKIVIELNNEPFIENHKNVIIIRSPRPEGRHGQGQGPRQQMKKRIIIRDGNPEKEEQHDKL
jgi:hypothetical protein